MDNILQMEQEMILNHEFLSAFEERVSEIQKIPLKKIPWPKFQILLGGDDYYTRIFKMIDSAESHIFIVSYTFDSSVVSIHILDGLIKALNRNVKVYLFLENLIELPKKEHLTRFKKNGGIIIQRSKHKYFKSMLNKTFFQRDHEKLFISDNKFIIGSANISEYYGDKRFGKPFFYDLNFYGKNCLVEEIADFLESYINSTKLKEHTKYYALLADLNSYVKSYKSCKITNKLIHFYSCNVPFNMSLQNKILELIGQAKKNIKIISAYYYPIKVVENAIIEAKNRGVEVELITSYKRDIPCYKNFVNGILFNNLLQNGIKVYQFKNQYLHAKSIGIDDRIVNIGSFNLDRWSWYNNIETVIHVEDSKQESREYQKIFDLMRLKSEQIRPQIHYKRSSKMITNLFWDNFFLKTCDRLMNRAFFAFHTEMENSIFLKMNKSMSWSQESQLRSQKMKQANFMVGQIELNKIKESIP